MVVSRRRIVQGVALALLLIVGVPTLWLAPKVNRTIKSVETMIIPTVTLPTATPAAQPDTAAPGPQAQPSPQPTAAPAIVGVKTILLVGTDARPGEDVSRTDTLVMVQIDSRTNRVGMLSFPRDLWVQIPGYGENRINSAYLIGETKLGKGYGPALLKRTVGDLVGQPIDHFVLINFQGFKSLIDKLGGISLDVPKTIDDPAYPTDDYGTMQLHFDAGWQQMDGERALMYARTRHADSDFGRNQRQQQVLLAIFERIRAQGLLGQLTNFDEYTEALSDYIRTDMTQREMLGIASLGAQLHAEDIQRFAIDSKMVTARTQPAYVLLLKDQKALRRLVTQMIDPSVASAGGEEPLR